MCRIFVTFVFFITLRIVLSGPYYYYNVPCTKEFESRINPVKCEEYIRQLQVNQLQIPWFQVNSRLFPYPRLQDQAPMLLPNRIQQLPAESNASPHFQTKEKKYLPGPYKSYNVLPRSYYATNLAPQPAEEPLYKKKYVYKTYENNDRGNMALVEPNGPLKPLAQPCQEEKPYWRPVKFVPPVNYVPFPTTAFKQIPSVVTPQKLRYFPAKNNRYLQYKPQIPANLIKWTSRQAIPPKYLNPLKYNVRISHTPGSTYYEKDYLDSQPSIRTNFDLYDSDELKQKSPLQDSPVNDGGKNNKQAQISNLGEIEIAQRLHNLEVYHELSEKRNHLQHIETTDTPTTQTFVGAFVTSSPENIPEDNVENDFSSFEETASLLPNLPETRDELKESAWEILEKTSIETTWPADIQDIPLSTTMNPPKYLKTNPDLTVENTRFIQTEESKTRRPEMFDKQREEMEHEIEENFALDNESIKNENLNPTIRYNNNNNEAMEYAYTELKTDAVTTEKGTVNMRPALYQQPRSDDSIQNRIQIGNSEETPLKTNTTSVNESKVRKSTRSTSSANSDSKKKIKTKNRKHSCKCESNNSIKKSINEWVIKNYDKIINDVEQKLKNKYYVNQTTV